MFRLWGKKIKKNLFVQDTVIAYEKPELTLNEKVQMAMDEISLEFDIEKPMWFDKNTVDMKKFGRTTFHDDQFIESIDFDYFEIEIIETDKPKGV